MIAYGIIEVDASPLKRLAIEPTGTDVQDARFSNNPFLKLQALHQQEISQDDTEGQDEISPPTSNDPRSPTEEFLTYLVTERRRLGTAKRTNLAAALDRATIYFNEPTSPPDTRDVLLLLTDGKDTTGRSYQVQLPDTVTILLVHDRPDDLGLLQPLRERLTLFENTAAAIQYVQRMLDRKEEPR